MLNRLEVRIKDLKRHSCFTGIVWLLLAIFIGLEIEAFLLRANTSAKIVFFILILMCVILLIYMDCKIKKLEPPITYCIRIPYANKEKLITSLNAESITEEAYLIMQHRDNCKLRILIQYISNFDRDVLAKQRKIANKKINKKYRIRNDLPLYDALKMLRVNLILCDTRSELLIQWVERDIVRLLGRTESIVNAAVILDEGILLFPDCRYGLSYIEIKKYELAAKTLCSLLSVS